MSNLYMQVCVALTPNSEMVKLTNLCLFWVIFCQKIAKQVINSWQADKTFCYILVQVELFILKFKCYLDHKSWLNSVCVSLCRACCKQKIISAAG